MRLEYKIRIIFYIRIQISELEYFILECKGLQEPVEKCPLLRLAVNAVM